VLLNKCDLGLQTDRDKASELFDNREVIELSALTGEGIDRVRDWIGEKASAGGLTGVCRERIAVNARQSQALRRGREAMEGALNDIRAGKPAEILAIWLREGAAACEEITGRSVEAEILDEIFNRFCIGK
jgi:tRNA modification GTPase